jgi:hypothetical protein
MLVKTPCTWRMKATLSKSSKTKAGKKRSHSEAEGSAPESSPPSPPRPNPTKEWKKSMLKTEYLLALVNNGFLREKEMDLWCSSAGDPYPMEKNPDEILMFAKFVERGLAVPASDFFKGLLRYGTLIPMAASMSLSSCTSARRLWELNPTKFCSRNSSE